MTSPSSGLFHCHPIGMRWWAQDLFPNDTQGPGPHEPPLRLHRTASERALLAEAGRGGGWGGQAVTSCEEGTSETVLQR